MNTQQNQEEKKFLTSQSNPEIKESPAGITLIGHNVAVYTPHFYSNADIKNLPVQVLGKVVEMRRKF